MIAPAPTLNLALRQFVFYDYYYYGFPFFAASALLLLPLQWLSHLGDIPLVMLILRQFVSVLPMLAALLLLVYMQDGFHSYRSPCCSPSFSACRRWYRIIPGTIPMGSRSYWLY